MGVVGRGVKSEGGTDSGLGSDVSCVGADCGVGSGEDTDSGSDDCAEASVFGSDSDFRAEVVCCADFFLFFHLNNHKNASKVIVIQMIAIAPSGTPL